MRGYVLGPDGFAPREVSPTGMLPEEVRVAVQHVCLEPQDFSDVSDGVCPGGGLVGKVVECGAAASALHGARVLVPQVVACGECDTCRRGAATVCPERSVLGRDRHGGCAEVVVCAARWLTRCDEQLDLDGPLAALVAGPALRAYALFCRVGLSAGDVAIILGGGATAEILAMLASSRGARVARCGHDDEKPSTDYIRSQLSELGALDKPQKLFVLGNESDFTLATELAHPASILIEATGKGNADLAALHRRELSLLSLAYPHPDLLPETVALVAKGELEIGALLSATTLGANSLDESRRARRDGKCLVLSHA
ncbi:MAG: alcohol dehydrogenase catalytic domain-containing protein [Myxococcales bacterium]|nr:alcohol dehydrogenase catalytic domain-containing protein [Myxococcales bacterium]